MRIETIKIPTTPVGEHLHSRATYTDRGVVFDHKHKDKERQQRQSAGREDDGEPEHEPEHAEEKPSHLDVVA